MTLLASPQGWHPKDFTASRVHPPNNPHWLSLPYWNRALVLGDDQSPGVGPGLPGWVEVGRDSQSWRQQLFASWGEKRAVSWPPEAIPLPTRWVMSVPFILFSFSLGLPFRTIKGMVARMTSQQGRSQSSRKNILREQRVRQCTQGSPVSGWFPLFLGWQHQSVIVQGWGSSDGNGGELKSTFAQRC